MSVLTLVAIQSLFEAMRELKEHTIGAVGLWLVLGWSSSVSFAESVTLFEDVVLQGPSAQRGPQLDMTARVVERALGLPLLSEPMPLSGSERATQPKSDSLESEKFQTALALLRDGERLFVNQQFAGASERFSAAMNLLENLTFEGTIHGLLVSTHIMWGEALVRRGDTSAARAVLGDLIALEPSITLSISDYPNAFLQMLDEVRLQRLSLETGTLRVRSPRTSVQVTIDENPLGMLPLEVSSVLPGIHVIRFETGTMGAKTRLVRLKPGATLELAFELDTLPAITSIHPGEALSQNAVDQVVLDDLLERVLSRGTQEAIVPIWSFEGGWKLSLLQILRDKSANVTTAIRLKDLLRNSKQVKTWWNKRKSIDVSSGWASVVLERPITLNLPSWLVGAPAMRSLLGAERLIELRSGAETRIDAILSGGEPANPVAERDGKRRPLTRAELAKKFEGQSYEATQPISLEDLVLEDEAEIGAPLWQRWWFWSAVGGVAAFGVTAIILAQDSEPSTVLVGVTWGED